MSAERPEVRWTACTEAPRRTRFETLEGGSGAELFLAGRGSVRADAGGVTVSLADESARAELAGLADGWGAALWRALNGVFSFHGATLERDGFGLALVGESRVGCSVTAVALAAEGWKLVADGECPLRLEADGSVMALPNGNELEVDTALTVMGPIDRPTAPTGARRPRSEIAVPRAQGECRISAIVEIRLARSTDEPALVPAERSELGAAGTLKLLCSTGEAILGRNSSLDGRLDAFCQAAVAGTPFVVALVPEGRPGAFFPPSAVAGFVADQVGGLEDLPASPRGSL